MTKYNPSNRSFYSEDAQKSYKNRDQLGKKIAINFFTDIGWKAIEHEDISDGEIYDILAEKDSKKIKVEIEMREKNWISGQFPYETISIPDRKFHKNNETDYYITIASDGNDLIIFNFKNASSSYMKKANGVLESFRDIKTFYASYYKLINNKWEKTENKWKIK